MRNDYLVIFGAAVRPDGTPSHTLVCRVAGAVALADGRPNTKFVVSGGVGKYGPAEALVMKKMLLNAGIPEERIITECQSRNTLSSILHCKEILDSLPDVGNVTVCSSAYHNPRCRLLFRIVGIEAGIPKMPSELQALGWRKWIYYHLREPLAIVWDALVLLGMRLLGRVKT